MNNAHFCCAALLLTVTSNALADNIVILDKVDPSDGIMQPPPGVVCIDVANDGMQGDAWTAAGVRGVALGGATLRYATDPNTGDNLLTNVGTANRFTTFFTRPRGRDSNGRYTNGGAAAAGRYCPTGPVPTSTPTEINVAYFASPPKTNGPVADGWVFRVALDIGATGHAAEEFAVFRLGDEPPGSVPYFLSDCEGSPNPGTVMASFNIPQITGIDWGVFIVPEPAGLLLVAALTAAMLVRRG